jgi:hypothetical protein
VLGANVVITDPIARGTTIIPPGTFSIVRLSLMSDSRSQKCESP